MALPLTFLSDYGYGDEFAGVCRLVIERLAPGTRIVDLTHGIPPGDVRRGALALEAAVDFGPTGVHLAVVDPGVGTARRAVALATGDGAFLVGPDNGLLALAAERLGGCAEAFDISRTPLRLEPLAPTFHGRDLFAPVAGHLAAGRPLAATGEPIDPAGLVRLALPEPAVNEGRAGVHVLYADWFGNLILDARPRDLAALGLADPGARLSVTASAGTFAATTGATFADAAPGESEGERGAAGGAALGLYGAACGRLALAVNMGSAAALLGAGRDDELELVPAP